MSRGCHSSLLLGKLPAAPLQGAGAGAGKEQEQEPKETEALSWSATLLRDSINIPRYFSVEPGKSSAGFIVLDGWDSWDMKLRLRSRSKPH